MDLNKVTSGSVKGREHKDDKSGMPVSDDDMNAFSQMLGEKSDKLKESSKEAIYSDKDEKKAEAEKARTAKNLPSEQKMSVSKELLYNSNRDKSTLSLAQKSAMGLNADGLTKAAMMNGGMTNFAQISMEMAKNQDMSKQAVQAGMLKGDDVSKIKTDSQKSASTGAQGNANANVAAEKTSEQSEVFNIKETQKTEKTDAERNLKREEVIKQIINHVELKNFGSKSELTIKMNPEFLGAMKMRLLFEGDKVSAEFNTTSKEVREALEESTEELTNALAENGVKVGKINVNLVDDVG